MNSLIKKIKNIQGKTIHIITNLGRNTVLKIIIRTARKEGQVNKFTFTLNDLSQTYSSFLSSNAVSQQYLGKKHHQEQQKGESSGTESRRQVSEALCCIDNCHWMAAWCHAGKLLSARMLTPHSLGILPHQLGAWWK